MVLPIPLLSASRRSLIKLHIPLATTIPATMTIGYLFLLLSHYPSHRSLASLHPLLLPPSSLIMHAITTITRAKLLKTSPISFLLLLNSSWESCFTFCLCSWC
ncbi:hypothetical protein OWV82_020295 [Melia azedarach]|uniref:Uncharacterized protein n=1 Tax=Melia azedarach TaxID=155640 RepID=A0ACC1X6D2_MELAZ|nr:hypothetical protein OWV82_020295 [Melia azedarach]